MPPPGSYIDITSTPFSRVVTQAEFNAGTYGGVPNEVWFRFPATGAVKLALGSFCNKGGTFTPRAEAYDADGSTFLRSVVVDDFAWYVVIDATTPKYIRILRSGGGASNFNFTVLFDTHVVNGATLADGDF